MPQVARIKNIGDGALVLFSGDAYNPSMLSTVTQASAARSQGSWGPGQLGLHFPSLRLPAAWPPGPVLLPLAGPVLALLPICCFAHLQGKQMVEVLNACGVHAACAGNHDFDFGVENLLTVPPAAVSPG